MWEQEKRRFHVRRVKITPNLTFSKNFDLYIEIFNIYFLKDTKMITNEGF